MRSEDYIKFLSDFDKLKNLDPDIRTIIMDHAIECINEVDAKNKAESESEKMKKEIDKKIRDIRSITNRYFAIKSPEINNYIDPGSDKYGDTLPENLFLANTILNLTDIGCLEGESVENMLAGIADKYLTSLEALCRYMFDGSACTFCDIDCKFALCTKSKEDNNKKREELSMRRRGV